MTSHLPLKRISSTVRFFRGVSAVRRQLAAADGLVGTGALEHLASR
jgi:hypothetical protein